MSNYDVIQRGIAKYGGSNGTVVKDVFQIMEGIANDIFMQINSSNVIPVDTGNLKDSTGIAIYNGSRLVRLLPNPIATRPRVNIGLKGYEKGAFWGKDLLKQAIEHAQGKFKDGGYYLVIFSAMPYAGIVNSKQNYFSNEIVDALNTIASVTAKYTNITFHKVNR